MSRSHRAPIATLTLVAACLVCIGVPAYAQTQPVTLAWDASRDSSVAGYIVYVGNAPGSYSERFDVGDVTTFVYRNVRTGQPYFFTVAAYADDHRAGPRSEEIFFMSGASTAVDASMAAPAPASTAREISSLSLDRPTSGIHSPVCAGASGGPCVGIEPLATVPGDVHTVTPAGDGRLFFIESGTRVRMIAGDTLMPDVALTADGATELTGLVLDPAFSRNRFVYVGEMESRADGSRMLSIVRYREVAGTFAEGALVTALPLPPGGDAPFTMDGIRRLYVAVPRALDRSTGDSPYGGMVLRFENDGSVPRDSRGGSPVFAFGYAEPLSLAWNAARNELWLAGKGAPWNDALARLPLGNDDPAWPRAPLGASFDAADSILGVSGAGDLVIVNKAEGVVRIDGRSLRAAAWPALGVSELGGEPMSAALDGNDVYVVVAEEGAARSGQAFPGPAEAGHHVRIVRVRKH